MARTSHLTIDFFSGSEGDRLNRLYPSLAESIVGLNNGLDASVSRPSIASSIPSSPHLYLFISIDRFGYTQSLVSITSSSIPTSYYVYKDLNPWRPFRPSPCPLPKPCQGVGGYGDRPPGAVESRTSPSGTSPFILMRPITPAGGAW